MLFRLGKKYGGYWESESNPVSVTFNEKIWKVISASDDHNDYFFSLFQKSEGSCFYITGEDLEEEMLAEEMIEEVIFARVFNFDNNISIDERFIDRIDSLPFHFVRFGFNNKKFGPQFVNYGYNVFDEVLVIVSLAWPEELEVTEGSYWPLKHEILISGINLGY